MPIHADVSARFALLEGISSLEDAMADPEMDRRVREFMAPPLGPAPDVPTRDVAVPGPHGPVPVRVYGVASGGAAFVWIHGGAFMFGDLDMPEADRTAREVCARSDALVVSVDYRLAVDGVHHPVPLDDCVAVVRWLRDSAADLGIDPFRIAVGGASAGGNLAVAAALRLRDEEGWQPALLVPVYPVLHATLPEPTPLVAAQLDEVPASLRFTPEGTAGINANYLGGQEPDGYSFPALADLTGLAPTLLVTAEYDDLRTTGESFVALLDDAGVDVRHVQADGMLHGFLNLSAELDPVDDVLDLVSAAVAAPVPQEIP